jgi:hypothetical protein
MTTLAKPTRSVTFRLPLPTYEALQQLAAEDRRSLNGIVTILLEEAITARQEKARG